MVRTQRKQRQLWVEVPRGSSRSISAHVSGVGSHCWFISIECARRPARLTSQNQKAQVSSRRLVCSRGTNWVMAAGGCGLVIGPLPPPLLRRPHSRAIRVLDRQARAGEHSPNGHSCGRRLREDQCRTRTPKSARRSSENGARPIGRKSGRLVRSGEPQIPTRSGGRPGLPGSQSRAGPRTAAQVCGREASEGERTRRSRRVKAVVMSSADAAARPRRRLMLDAERPLQPRPGCLRRDTRCISIASASSSACRAAPGRASFMSPRRHRSPPGATRAASYRPDGHRCRHPD